MAEPKVSVIIPTYNQKDFAREAIDSVLAQTYINIEIIVTDDGSADGTREIIQEYASKYPDKIKLCVSSVNTGISGNINRALAVRTGDYIAWLGGDDLMLPGKIKKQVELLESRPDAVGCCHDAEVFESDSGKALGLFSELYNGRSGFREGGVELLFDAGYKMLPSTLIFRASACPSHGFDDRLVFANDWLFDIELFRQGPCIVINEALARYRRHADNITAKPATKSRSLEECLIVMGIVDARYPELHRHVRKRRIVLFLTEAVKSFAVGERHRFRKYIQCSFRERAVFHGIMTYIGCYIFGSMLISTVTKPVYQMPHWFVKTVNILRGRF